MSLFHTLCSENGINLRLDSSFVRWCSRLCNFFKWVTIGVLHVWLQSPSCAERTDSVFLPSVTGVVSWSISVPLFPAIPLPSVSARRSFIGGLSAFQHFSRLAVCPAGCWYYCCLTPVLQRSEDTLRQTVLHCKGWQDFKRKTTMITFQY